MPRFRRLQLLSLVVILSSFALPARAEHEKGHDEAGRFEVSFMLGYDSLTGDATEQFDSGPYGGFGFEVALTKPRTTGGFRNLGVRLTAGYALFDGTQFATTLDGPVFSIDAMLAGNFSRMAKPYLFVGVGFNALADDIDIVTGGDGIGYSVGVGCKFFLGERLSLIGEISQQSYATKGEFYFSPSSMQFVQFRFGVGVRF